MRIQDSQDPHRLGSSRQLHTLVGILHMSWNTFVRRHSQRRFVGCRPQIRYGDGTVATGGSFYDAVQIGDLEVAKQLLIQVDTMESEPGPCIKGHL